MEDIAEKIRKEVSRALDSAEFDTLNQAIKDTVDSALTEARQQFDRWNAAANTRASSGGWNAAANTQANGREIQTDWRWSNMPKPLRIRVKWKGKISGTLMSVFGGVGSVIFGISALTSLFVALIALDGGWAWGVFAFLGALTVSSAALLVLGQQRCGRVERLQRYVEEMKRLGKSRCEIKRLSQVSGRSEQFVQKDMKKILIAGMLPEARMDDEGTCLMLDDEAYRQYRRQQEEQRVIKEEKRREEARRERDRTEARWHEGQAYEKGAGGVDAFENGEKMPDENGDGGDGTGSQTDRSTGNAAVDEAIARGEEYMESLDHLREALPEGCEMTQKLLRLDQILERLFGTLRRYPDQLDELERFMEYYLPTTVKLVKAYQEFTAVEFPGDNIKKAKAEIEATMDTINGAFEKLLDDMYEDTAFDVMTDASVLQTMLAREGLTEKDFQWDGKSDADES